MSDQLQELSGNPGRILKAAREEAGLSLVQAAEALHLRGSVVDAIEREDYATFSSPIFLKGYFRSYCRLLKLHEERMLALLEKQLQGHYGAMDDAKIAQDKAEQAQVRQRMLKKLGLFLVLLLVPIALLFVTTSTLNKNDDASGQQTEPPAESGPASSEQSAPEPADALAETVPEQEFAYSEGEDPGAVEQTPETAALAEAEPRAEGDIADAAAPHAPVPAPVVTAPPLATVADVPVAEVAKPAPALDGSKALRFVFTADCWLKLTDGKGKVLVAELKYDGDTYEVSALAPLTVVLGNARAVTLSVDNQPYDLLQHTTQNGRAALVIK